MRLVIPPKVWDQVERQLLPAISDDKENRPMLCSMLIEPCNDGIRFVATDGHRMSVLDTGLYHVPALKGNSQLRKEAIEIVRRRRKRGPQAGKVVVETSPEDRVLFWSKENCGEVVSRCGPDNASPLAYTIFAFPSYYRDEVDMRMLDGDDPMLVWQGDFDRGSPKLWEEELRKYARRFHPSGRWLGKYVDRMLFAVHRGDDALVLHAELSDYEGPDSLRTLRATEGNLGCLWARFGPAAQGLKWHADSGAHGAFNLRYWLDAIKGFKGRFRLQLTRHKDRFFKLSLYGRGDEGGAQSHVLSWTKP